jgi:hypothetical protein
MSVHIAVLDLRNCLILLPIRGWHGSCNLIQ